MNAPCIRCGHGPEFHRHDDAHPGQTATSCMQGDGSITCGHMRCLHPWAGRDFDPEPACDCPDFVQVDPS